MSEIHILVIDDDLLIREIVATTLELSGYRVSTAANGRQGLERLDQEGADVIMLDMRMPVMDGWAFAEVLSERGDTTPIVVMTATVDAQRWADEIGAQACLPKPFNLHELVSTVEQLAA